MKKPVLYPVLAMLVLLLLRPETVSAAVREGLVLCVRTVIPSLFPFFVVTSLLLGLGLAEGLQKICGPFMGPLFRMRGTCALPLLTGLVGGYPSGARTTAELYQQGRLTRQEADLMLGFCDNCGPAFVLSYVGGAVLGSVRAGAWLYLIHVFSALTAGAILCRVVKDRGPVPLPCRLPAVRVSFARCLTDAVSGALASTLSICAFVVVFTVLTALLPAGTPAVVSGALEMVSGVAALSPDRTGFVLAAAVVSWGGLSVHCQAMAATVPAGLGFRWHWIGKALQAGIAAIAALAVRGWAFP